MWMRRIIETYGYESWARLGESLAPTFKYQITLCSVMFSALGTLVGQLFGLNWLAFVVLLLVFVLELATGLARAAYKGEDFQSAKLSRFLFKISYYLLIISISFLMSVSFRALGKNTAGEVFDWMHVFFTIQIVVENVVSIAENIAVVSGKEPSHWVRALQDRVNGLFK
jgi:phage-related holin